MYYIREKRLNIKGRAKAGKKKIRKKMEEKELKSRKRRRNINNVKKTDIPDVT